MDKCGCNIIVVGEPVRVTCSGVTYTNEIAAVAEKLAEKAGMSFEEAVIAVKRAVVNTARMEEMSETVKRAKLFVNEVKVKHISHEEKKSMGERVQQRQEWKYRQKYLRK
jgi:predicted Zn-dependent protease